MIYLVRQKGFIVKFNTWKERENLENTKEAIKEFENEYWQDIKKVNQQEKEKGMFKKEEFLERFMTKKLFGWSNKRYDKEYQGRLERNQRYQKEEQVKKTLEIVKKKEEETK